MLVGVALVLMVGGVLATIEAWADILDRAERDPESSQIWLVPVVVAWLCWIRRGRLRGHVPSNTWFGPVLVLAGWMIHRTGDLQLIESFWHLGAVIVLTGCLVSVGGTGMLVRFLPAFATLCFLVPVPGRVRQAIALPLQSVTAQVTQQVLDLMGVAVERSGNVLHINHRDVMIAEACNGLRMVFALLMVSFTFAYTVPLRNYVRVAVVLATPLTAIVFNVVRLVPVVWASSFLPKDVATLLHDASGWVMLPCAFLSLLGVMRLLRWAHVPITPYTLAYGN